ncbi:F0F1 ATP synthase subunit A [Clostridium taeniosporum]|uniref:ATP synthase subunit a n=1 Tax=Clostridium taeniosporum TaxID=394958 RepID=A0A1D7XGX5_9CLOT|nr:F0F1 ATP synthase subunit A [Clostridium taeniosporum]AOR22601.1 F0F1 ATP synthase subunit A [Clostridium taeniosporum]
MEPSKVVFSFNIGNFPVDIIPEIIIQWVIILALAVTAYLLTRNLKQKPDKKQAALEKFYETVKSLVSNTMGESYLVFVPYVGTLIIYLLLLNFTGLVGIKPPTQNLSVTVGMAITTFVVINFTAIKRNGLGKYFKGLTHPFIGMLPINIMERVMLPVSLALRLFGNMLAATILVDLVYQGLGSIATVAQIGLPIAVHVYFDLFDGTIQMLVFTMLTIINIKTTTEH